MRRTAPPSLAGAAHYDKIDRLRGFFDTFECCGVAMLVVLIEQRTQFHVEAMAATQSIDNPASRELLARMRELLAQAGVSENALGAGRGTISATSSRHRQPHAALAPVF